MASPEAMEKLRAVLDYIPEEAADRLPGDEPEYYDALTRRIHRSVGVKRTVKRRVIVEQPDTSEGQEPEGPVWTPPEAPPEPEEPEVAAVAVAEAVTTVEAQEPMAAAPAPAPAPTAPPKRARARSDDLSVEPGGDDDFFDFGGGGGDYDVVEGSAAGLSANEWSQLDASPEEDEVDAVFDDAAWDEGHDDAPHEQVGDGEAFEEVLLPEDGAAFGETGVAEGDLEPFGGAPEELALSEPAEADLAAEPEFETLDEDDGDGPTTLELGGEVEGDGEAELEVLGETDAPMTPDGEPAFQVNEYTLYHRTQRGSEGTIRDAYFFSVAPVADAQPAELPEGYAVTVHPQSGVPSIRRGPRVMPITELAGLGPIMAERLERAGVNTTADLLVKDLNQVTAATSISDRLLRSFQAQAALLSLETVAPEEAAAMVHAGVRSLDDLRDATPSELARAMEEAAQQHQLELPEAITAPRVRAWQELLQRR